MNRYRERLESAGALRAFERARAAGDADVMQHILRSAQFTPREIESILWAKGDLGPAPAPEDKRQRFREMLIERFGFALISGLILGGIFVYASSGLSSARRSGENQTDVLMSDQRSPKEAYYQPFLFGFALGAVGGFVTRGLLYDPTAKKP